MQSLSGLQSFQALLSSVDRTGPEALRQRFSVSAGKGGEAHSLTLARPASPPFSWSSLIGALVGSGPQATTGEQKALLEFRSYLEHSYGKEIGQSAGRSLKESFLTAKAAEHAIAHAQAESRAINAEAFDKTLRESKAGAGEGKSASAGASGPSFRYDALPANMKQLLARVTLGQDMEKGKADPERIEAAASIARGLLDKMAATPGLSMVRAEQMLHTAAMSPRWSIAQSVMQDLLAGPHEKRLLLDQAPCPPGASVRTLLGEQFTGRAVTSPDLWTKADGPLPDSTQATVEPKVQAMQDAVHQVHAQTVRLVQEILNDPEKLIDIPRTEGQPPLQLARQCVTDCHRFITNVNGMTLPKDQDAFPGALRTAFPAGEGGDAMARMISALINQAPLGPLVGHAWNSNFHYRPAKDSEAPAFCADITEQGTGQWSVRLSVCHEIRERTDRNSDTGSAPMPSTAMALMTIDFTVDPGKDGRTPTLAGMATDVVYNSGTKPQAS